MRASGEAIVDKLDAVTAQLDRNSRETCDAVELLREHIERELEVREKKQADAGKRRRRTRLAVTAAFVGLVLLVVLSAIDQIMFFIANFLNG